MRADEVLRVTAALSLLLLALLLGPEPARAGSGLLIGVHDDSIKWTERPKPILGAMRALGLGGMRVTLEWRPGKRHLTGSDHDALRRAVAAKGYGVRTVLGVYGRAADAPRDRAGREDYCRFVRNVLHRYGEVRDVVIWNEANSDTFWLPREGAAADYAALLARCWDLLHASISGVNVLTTTASSHDPAGFIRDVGAAYRASGRQRPLFDAAGHNPYSLFPGEPPTARHEEYIGQGDYDRLVAVLDESFAGTAQSPAPIWYLENGFQTTVGKGAARTIPAARPLPGRSSRQSRQLRSPRLSGSPIASLASPRTSTSCSSTRRCSEAGSPACSGPTGAASLRSRPTGRRSPRSAAAPSTARRSFPTDRRTPSRCQAHRRGQTP